MGDYVFESEQQFVEYSYNNWNITLSDEIDYIGISVRHKTLSAGEDWFVTILNETYAKLQAEAWCNNYDNCKE